MGCTLFWVKFGHAFAYFVVFAQESFCLQGILDEINEQDTSFLDTNTNT